MLKPLLTASFAALFLLIGNIGHASETAKVAIIIDDIGYQMHANAIIAAIPYPLTTAILPEAPYAKQAATLLHQSGKELILHLPMQGSAKRALEPTVLKLGMQQADFVRQLRYLLDHIDHIVGFNNHQGSVLTADSQAMRWLMREIAKIDDFYFIDSRTSGRSTALATAKAYQIPSASRDIFLDHLPTAAFINQQFELLIKTAKRKNSAIAIAHPHPITLQILQQRLAELAQHHIQIVPASELVKP